MLTEIGYSFEDAEGMLEFESQCARTLLVEMAPFKLTSHDLGQARGRNLILSHSLGELWTPAPAGGSPIFIKGKNHVVNVLQIC